MRNNFFVMFFFVIILFNLTCKSNTAKSEGAFMDFIKNYETKVVELSKNTNISYFDASISGKKEDYAKYSELNIKLNKIYSVKEDFEVLQKFVKSNDIEDKLLKRQLKIIYNAYLGNQIDEKLLEEMIKLQTKLESQYSTFRSNVDGKDLTDNQVEETLGKSTDNLLLMKTWLASKTIGKVIKSDVIKLVKMRNDSAHKLGYKNYHDMSLSLSQQDPNDIEKLFDELDVLTAPTFSKLKSEMDVELAKKYKISVKELMPWHYQNRFFQEAPSVYNVDLDSYYKGKDLVKITSDYYKGLGLPIDEMVAKSDLFEKKGKYQHAYCTNIDRKKDVRVVCNVKSNSYWMDTMLHEYGHAVYDRYIDSDLAWTLREPAHIFTTEAVAMMFGRLGASPQWLHDSVGISKEEATKIKTETFKVQRLKQLVFSRWVQVVYRFEKAMYSNPDQDLNKLWWDYVEKYQMIKRPLNRDEPDWATKIHIALYPAYYHNYMMGELLASQLYFYIVKNVIKSKDTEDQSFTNRPEVGQYLLDKVFKPGATYYWNDMIQKATGEKLTARYYADQFVD